MTQIMLKVIINKKKDNGDGEFDYMEIEQQ